MHRLLPFFVLMCVGCVFVVTSLGQVSPQATSNQKKAPTVARKVKQSNTEARPVATPSVSATPTGTPSGNAPAVPSPSPSTTSTKPEKVDLRGTEVLSWINNDRPVLWGLLFFICGALGGLITAAFSLGDTIPGIGGSSLTEADEAKAAALQDNVSRRQAELESVQTRISQGDSNVTGLQFVATQHMQQITSMQEQIQTLQTRISANRWASWKFGMPIYVIVGGGTSLLLAKDILQAILFGATWTSVVAAIGLKSNAQQKQDVARQAASDLASKLEQVSKENVEMRGRYAVLQNNLNQTAQIADAALKRLRASPPSPPSSN
jgi:hypothetical protein